MGLEWEELLFQGIHTWGSRQGEDSEGLGYRSARAEDNGERIGRSRGGGSCCIAVSTK